MYHPQPPGTDLSAQNVKPSRHLLCGRNDLARFKRGRVGANETPVCACSRSYLYYTLGCGKRITRILKAQYYRFHLGLHLRTSVPVTVPERTNSSRNPSHNDSAGCALSFRPEDHLSTGACLHNKAMRPDGMMSSPKSYRTSRNMLLSQ